MTLTSTPLAPLLDRLFKQAREATSPALARVRAPGSGYLSVPFADDVELSMRLG